MDQKLSELVDKVEGEARKFATFDEYLESKEMETECQKPASDAGDNSSSVESAKVDAPVESSQPTSAETVTAPTKEEHPHLRLTPEYIANGHKVEPAHPIAVVVVTEVPVVVDPPTEVPVVVNRIDISAVNWADGKTLRSLEDIAQAVKPGEEPESWRKIFLLTRDAGEKLTLEEIVDRIHELEDGIQKFKQAQRGYRSALEDKLKIANSETRTKMVGELDKDYRARRNAKAAERMKSERGATAPKANAAPKAGAGIKLADQYAQGLGLRGDALCDFLQKAGKLDEATAAHVRTKWGSK